MNTTTRFLITGLTAGCAAILGAQETPPYIQPQQQPPSAFTQPGAQEADDPFVGDTPADVPQPQQPAETTPLPDPGVVVPQPSGRTYVGGLPSDGPPPPVEPMPDDMPQPTYAPPPLPVQPADAYQYFYQPLSPYGEWVFIPGYGYCWRPGGVPYGWRPYWDGHWVWSECGWMWVSEEPWGWATYHYGRWTLTSEFGWIWVPGRRWAPAWVCWRQGPDFIGWAPLPPGAPIGVGFYSDAFSISIGCWTMVYERDFLSPHCRRVAFPIHRHHEFLPRARTVINVNNYHNHIVNVGPGRRHIERVAGHTVPTLRVRSAEVSRADARVTTRVHADTIVVHQPGRTLMAKPADTARIKRAEKVTVVREPAATVPPRTTLKATTTGAHGAATRTITSGDASKGKPAKTGSTPTMTPRTVMPDAPRNTSTAGGTRREGNPPSATHVQPPPSPRVKTVTPPATTLAPAKTTSPDTRSTDTKARGRKDDDMGPAVRTPASPIRTYTPKDAPKSIAPKTNSPPSSNFRREDSTPRLYNRNDSGHRISAPQASSPARNFAPPSRPQSENRVHGAPSASRVAAAPPPTTQTPPSSAARSRGRGSKADEPGAPR